MLANTTTQSINWPLSVLVGTAGLVLLLWQPISHFATARLVSAHAIPHRRLFATALMLLLLGTLTIVEQTVGFQGFYRWIMHLADGCYPCD